MSEAAIKRCGRQAAPLCAIALALAAEAPACARDLTPSDLRVITRIQQDWNGRIRRRAGPYDCNTFAVNKLFALQAAGFGPDEVRLGRVLTDKGEEHAVAEVKGELKGAPVTIVLDSLWPWTETRAALEGAGYHWLQEWPR